MSNLLSNVRYALRQFRLSPIFTVAAVLTLALGIGGTTAIFTLIHAVMLRSLPVADPGRLYRVGSGDDCWDDAFGVDFRRQQAIGRGIGVGRSGERRTHTSAGHADGREMLLGE